MLWIYKYCTNFDALRSGVRLVSLVGANDLGIHPRQMVVNVVLLLVVVALHTVSERARVRVSSQHIPVDPCIAAASALTVRNPAHYSLMMPSNLYKQVSPYSSYSLSLEARLSALAYPLLAYPLLDLPQQRISTYPTLMTLRPSMGSSLACSDGGRGAWGGEAEVDA